MGAALLGVAALGVVALGAAPSSYVVDQPGPAVDVLGTTNAQGSEEPLISIPDAETYPTEGRLDLLTVTRVGNREQAPTWFQVVQAWLDPSKSIVPLDSAYPLGTSTEEVAAANRVSMQNSQQQAVAAALTHLDYEFDSTLTIASLTEGSPARGALEVGDELISVDGTRFSDVQELRDAVAAHGTESPARVTVERDGEQLTVDVTPESVEGMAVLGVTVAGEYDFPFEVDIELANIGGPSAGTMFALGIVDTLTPGAMTGGENIAGTGTITATGQVGPIGGIRQKMYGALAADAPWFLAPAGNCDEVVGHVPDGLTVVSIATLDEAVDAVETIGEGGDVAALPTCEAD